MGVGKFLQVSRSEISLQVKGERPNSLCNDTRSPRIELQAAAVYNSGSRVDFLSGCRYTFACVTCNSVYSISCVKLMFKDTLIQLSF